MFFPDFTLEHVAVASGSFRLRRGGSGPPLLLLHGNPQTHAIWHAVAPALAKRFTVVCPDLRGYGESSKPPTTADHAPYSKFQAGHGRRLRTRPGPPGSSTCSAPNTAPRTWRTTTRSGTPRPKSR